MWCYSVSIDRNKVHMENIQEIANKLKNALDEKEIFQFMTEILTESELETLSKRWRILKMLKEGRTQRDIAKELNVSLCKVTRGSKLLQNSGSVSTKYL